MGGALIEAGQQRTGLGRHDGHFMILSGESFHRRDGIEPHDGGEFDFIGEVAPGERDAAITSDGAFGDAGEDFIQQ